MGLYDVQIGDAEIVDPWEISIGDASLFPGQESNALELTDPWQVLIGDAQMDPSISVDVGDPYVLGPDEFFMDDGRIGRVEIGTPEIRDPWK